MPTFSCLNAYVGPHVEFEPYFATWSLTGKLSGTFQMLSVQLIERKPTDMIAKPQILSWGYIEPRCPHSKNRGAYFSEIIYSDKLLCFYPAAVLLDNVLGLICRFLQAS